MENKTIKEHFSYFKNERIINLLFYKPIIIGACIIFTRPELKELFVTNFNKIKRKEEEMGLTHLEKMIKKKYMSIVREYNNVYKDKIFLPI